jgi:hypothetical protein
MPATERGHDGREKIAPGGEVARGFDPRRQAEDGEALPPRAMALLNHKIAASYARGASVWPRSAAFGPAFLIMVNAALARQRRFLRASLSSQKGRLPRPFLLPFSFWGRGLCVSINEF